MSTERRIAELEKVLDSGWVPIRSERASALALEGKTDEARKVLDEVKALIGQQVVDPGMIASVYADLGDAAEVFRWLQRALGEHSTQAEFLLADPKLDRYRSDPRFAEFRRAMKNPGGK